MQIKCFLKSVAFTITTVLVLYGEVSAAELQKAQNWCWASCVQYVLELGQVYQSQEMIAARLDGWPRDRPAHSQELVLLMRSYGRTAYALPRPPSLQELVNTLRSNYVIIAFVRPSGGMIGHFIVVSGIRADGMIVYWEPMAGLMAGPPAQVYGSYRWEHSVVTTPFLGM